MAKKRFRIKDRSGNVVDYDVAASSVTLNDGVDVEQKIADIDEEVTDLSETRYRKPVNGVPRTDLDNDVNSSLDKADSAIQGLIVNNEEVVPDSTAKKVRISIPTQVQSDWNESSQSSPAFIKNKPTVVSNVFYEPSTGKIWVSTGSRVTELIDINTFFNSISYNSSNNIISFLNKRGVVVATLDASSFVVDKFVENVTLDSSTNELVITFNTASGKSPIRVPLGSISGQGTVQSVKMNGGTPIQPVNGVIDLGTVITEHQSLSSYATKNYVDQAVQQAEQGETVVTSVDDVVLVDGFNSNTVLAGATARSVKELYDNVMALRNALAGIAFKDGLPAWKTVPQVTYSMDYTGLTNFAEPQTTSWVEGSEVTVVLRAASGYVLNANVASAMTVTDMEDNALTLSQNPTFDSTGGTISFKIAHIDRNFKVTASAAQALAVAMKANSNLNLSPQGVISGETFSGTITPANGYKLPTTIDGNNVSGSHGTVTYTRTSNTQGTITIANVTSALTINADAVELTPYTATIDDDNTGKVSGSNNNAPIEGQPWSTEISLNSSASEDDSITGITATMEGGGQIIANGNTVSTNSVTGNITITVTVATVSRHTIILPTNEHVVVKASDNSAVLKAADNTAPTNPKVTEGEPFSCYISAEEVEQKIIGSNSPYTSYELSNVRITMGSQDVTETSLDRSSGKITINAVTGAVAITTDSIAFNEGSSIGSNGDFAKQDYSYYADNNNLDYCCTKDYIPIPSDKGITKIIAGAGGKYGVRDSFLPYIAFYKYDNGSYEFISSVCIGQKSSGTPSWFMGADVPITKNEEQVYPTHFRIGFKTDIDQSDTVTIGGTTTGKRVNSLRKKRFVIGLDAQDNVTYLYRGIGYDGRYEDREGGYGISWCTALDASNTSVQDQYMSGCVTKLISVGGASTLDCVLGKLQPYRNNYSNILFFDQNENFISGVKTSDTSDTSPFTEKAVTVPSNAAYFRLTTANPDEAYVKNHDNGEYLYKGIYVTDN